MSANKSGATVLRIVIGIGLLGLGALGMVSLLQKEVSLALFGETATGTVRKVEEITNRSDSKWSRSGMRRQVVRRSGPSYFMTIDFTTPDGRTIEFETLATFHTEAKVGDQHPLVYLPSQPENAKIATSRQLWLPMLVGSIFTVTCWSFGIFLLWPRRRATSP